MILEKFLKDQYDVRAEQISKLEGYDSINYKIETSSDTYVLKQYDKTESNREILLAENATLKVLSELKAFDFPAALPNKKMEHLVEEDDALFRLLSFVEGEFLGDVEHTPTLLRSFGKFLGEIDNALLNFERSAISAKVTPWDLKHFHLSYNYLKYIPDARQRSLVDYFFLQYEEQVQPLSYLLRTSTIHNDGNDWNVLTRNGEVSGIIDFGDMCHSWLINELAVALTYIMMQKEHPLEVAQEVISAYHEVLPLRLEELDILYYLIAARLCTSVCNSAYTKTIKPDSDYITVSEKPAWELLFKLISISPIKARDTFRKAAGFEASKKPDLAQQLSRRNAALSKTLSLSYDEPIQMYRSAFQYMYDTDGNAILDAYNNIMITGHCHPRVVRAGQGVMARLNTNTRYVYEELLSYSERLLSKFPDPLTKVFFVNSGSAASDLAIRLATAYTGKGKVLGLEHGYHGNTRMGIAISHYKYNHKRGMGKSDTTLATPMPKVMDSGFEDDGSAGAYYAKMALKTIHENQHSIAAFVAEPIVGCGGQVPLAKGYLNTVYPEIRAQGGVCISDEVQVGFGRLGDTFWGFEMYGVVPDIVILGKPMGNGHPIGAVVTTSEIAAKFEEGPEFFSSFGGNPVSCAIGSAVLEVIETERLQEHAREVGNYLKKLLNELQKAYHVIADVRGNGLFLGIELVDGSKKPNTKLAAHIKNKLREKHILVSTDGPDDNVIKIKPPLSFNKEDAQTLVSALTSIFRNLG